MLAKQVVTLDHLTDGRAVLGVGLGYPAHEEFGAFGDPADDRERAALLDEGLDVITALLDGRRGAPPQRALPHRRPVPPGAGAGAPAADLGGRDVAEQAPARAGLAVGRRVPGVERRRALDPRCDRQGRRLHRQPDRGSTSWRGPATTSPARSTPTPAPRGWCTSALPGDGYLDALRAIARQGPP